MEPNKKKKKTKVIIQLFITEILTCAYTPKTWAAGMLLYIN